MRSKVAKNPRHAQGIYGPTTTVGDLINMLQELDPNKKLKLVIEDPRNPWGWIDIKEIEVEKESVFVKTTCHQK